MSSSTKQKTVVDQIPDIGPTDIVRAIVTPLASLKLTVFLLVLGVLVVFIATLDQTRHDVFHVKMKHFENAFVEVPFQTFFVPRWFPDRQDIPGSFYIPSGLTVLILMLVNLGAAHALRFKLKARGLRLIAGLIAALVAGFATWAVIFNGQSPSGFQAAPPIPFTQMWILMQIGMLGMAICSLVAFFMVGQKRIAERIILGVGLGCVHRKFCDADSLAANPIDCCGFDRIYGLCFAVPTKGRNRFASSWYCRIDAQ